MKNLLKGSDRLSPFLLEMHTHLHLKIGEYTAAFIQSSSKSLLFNINTADAFKMVNHFIFLINSKAQYFLFFVTCIFSLVNCLCQLPSLFFLGLFIYYFSILQMLFLIVVCLLTVFFDNFIFYVLICIYVPLYNPFYCIFA